jgi:hypothetical protein
MFHFRLRVRFLTAFFRVVFGVNDIERQSFTQGQWVACTHSMAAFLAITAMSAISPVPESLQRQPLCAGERLS